MNQSAAEFTRQWLTANSPDLLVIKAEGEYEAYRHRQGKEYISDFDREIKHIEGRMP